MNHPFVGVESRPFLGDFDLLPVAARLHHGEVPTHPTSDDFQLAAMRFGDSADAAGIWFLEAVRERRHNPGVKLDEVKDAIAARVAKRLFALCRE